MSTIDEILATISEADATETIDELLVIDPNSRQINIPSAELTFGVESDTHSERKYFQCARFVGDNIDLASCFIRVNYRNANGEMDAYLVDDVKIVGENIVFSWVLSRKVTQYMGQVRFVVCACRPGAKTVEWNTTQANGVVLSGLEPDTSKVESETADVVAQLIAMVENQTTAVETVGAEQVAAVQTQGETACEAVVTTAEAEKASVLTEIEAKGTNTLASIPDDYTALGEAVATIERGMAPGIVCEVEGVSAYVSDASENYVQSLRVFGRSTQDGVPTPDAPEVIKSVENPTVTVCGKNLWNHENDSLDMASVKGWGTAIWKNDYVTQMFKPNTTYTLSFSVTCLSLPEYDTLFSDNCGFVLFSNAPGGKYIEMAMDSGNGAFSVGETRTVTGTFTTPSNLRDKSLGYAILRYTQRYTKSDGTPEYATVKFEDVQIEEGTVATEYNDYRGGTLPLTHSLLGIPVTSGGNYTDGDGQQWVCDEVDLERWVYVRRVGSRVFTGNETWEKGTSVLNGMHRYYTWEYDMRPDNSGFGLCSHYPRTPFAAEQVTSECVRFGQNNIAVFFFTPSIATTEEWTSYVSDLHSEGKPITIQYVLTTPIETPLSETEVAAYRALRTNKPNTSILNDAGAWMNVEYVADTKLYIDNKIAAIVGGN